MARYKKTFEVSKLLKIANDALLNSEDNLSEYRQGVIAMIEEVLHKSGNYCGFGYLDAYDMVKSSRAYSVGINSDDNGYLDDYDARFKDTDDTRRKYFLKIA